MMKFIILMVAVGFLSINTCAIARGSSHDDNSGYHGYGIGHSHSLGLKGFGPSMPSYGIGSSTSSTNVRGYTGDDGTYAPLSRRPMPDNSINNNWTTQGNYNPYAGTAGTRQGKDSPYGN